MPESRINYYGNAFRQAIIGVGANVNLNPGLGRVQVLNPQAISQSATLPDATILPLSTGSPVFFLQNIHTTATVLVKDKGGNTIHTLQPSTTCIVALADNSTANGDWHFMCLATDATITTSTTPATTTAGTTTATTTTATPTQTPTTTTPATTTPPVTTTATGFPTGEHFDGGAKAQGQDRIGEGF